MSATLERVREELAAGAPVIIPTDTVYGIAVLPQLADAVRQVFRLKERPLDKPMPVLGDSLGRLRSVAEFSDRAADLAAKFWPGPLTMVLPRAPGFDFDLGGDFAPTVAVRVPDRAVTIHLLELIGPLAVTSANPSGEPPATTPAEARDYFGRDIVVLEDGPAGGVPSTVVMLDGEVTVLRAGSITAEQLADQENVTP